MNIRRFGRGVAMVGAGTGKFGAFDAVSSRDLFVEAFQALRDSVDKAFDPNAIAALYIGNFSSERFEHQGHLAPLLADAVGLVPKAATRIEDACASGGVALRQGAIAIASGVYDVVLVGGVERMTALPTAEVTDVLGTAGDALFELPAGFTFPGFYAAIASAYLHRYGMTPEDLMHVAIKNHANGALNPNAQFNMSIQQWMDSRKANAQSRGKPVPAWADEMAFLHDDAANPMIAWPLRLFDCSPITDGASAVLLVADEIAHNFTDAPIHIVGSGQASGHALHDRDDLTTIHAARRAGQDAYAMAGVTPDDIRIAEVHDCFTIAEVVATEDLGFFAPGAGYCKAQEGVTARDGAKPVNTSGGLKAKGHPVGASGVAQAVEIFMQMRGEAGDRQVAGDIPLALTHNVGATGSTCVVHIYERRQ